MRAAVISEPGGPEVFRVQEIEEPEVGPDDALVQVRATALNRADLIQRRGRYPAPAGVRQDVPGLEMAGEVLQVGARVTAVASGDRVFALLPGGGYAERVAVHERMLMRVPDDMGFADAASVPEAFFTAYDALFNQAGLQMGELVLVHAAGSGVGTAAIQLARQAGATTYATAGSAEKLAKAVPLGLDVGINYHEEDFAEVIAERTVGRGVDVVLDVIGAPYWERNLGSMAMLGRMVLVGSMGGSRLEINLGLLGPKRLRVHGTMLRSRSLEEKLALTEQVRRHVLPLLASGKLRPVVDRVFPLAEVSAAHEYMEANRNFGKIVLTLDA